MLSAFTNVVRIPELRQRILFTIAIIFIVRLGANIPLPGISSGTLEQMVANATQPSEDGSTSGTAAIASMLAMFTGGALQQAAVFALGIMPYISASIIMQMLTVLVPPMAKIQREEGGRQKIGQFTRYLTILLCIGQGYMLLAGLQSPDNHPIIGSFYDSSTMDPLVANPGFFQFILPCLLILVSGTMLLLWLGEMITEKGIGNGVSIIITVNIIAALPGTIVLIWETLLTGPNVNALSGMALVILVALLLLVIAGVITVTQGQRRIPVQYPKQAARGRKMVGANSQTSYLPLKVNYSGVMPVIFGSALMILPSTVMLPLLEGIGDVPQWLINFQQSLTSGNWVYYAVMSAMIFAFSFFWVSIFFQPQQMADDLKRGGGYVPGVRPGKPTADFLDRTMTRLTFAGASFLSLIVIVPALIFFLMFVVFDVTIPPSAQMIFGGTSIMIMVGVLLDVMKQLETHLIQRNYEGFLRKGRIKGGRYGRVGGTNQVVRKDQAGAMLWLYIVLAIIALVGSILWIVKDKKDEAQQQSYLDHQEQVQLEAPLV